jgi:hypothetical protein
MRLRKSLLPILVASALLLSAASGSDEKHQNETIRHEHSSKAKAATATPSITIIVQPAPVQIIQPSAPIEQKKATQKWYQRPTVTDWGVFAVTLVYALISVGLLNATWNQATLAKGSLATAKQAAKAAEQSAKTAETTLNYLERPWIFPVIESMENWNRFWPANEQIITLKLHWHFQNFGRSPAFLTQGFASLVLQSAPLPEDVPTYQYADKFALIPVPQGVPQGRETAISLTQEDHTELVKGNAILWFYGRMGYRDTFDKDHESRWVAKLTVSRLVMTGYPDSWWSFEGPPAYTNYT